MLKNAKGFSLVEGLVAVGLMAVVGLGLASLMTTMTKSQKGIRDASEVQNTVNELQMLLSNSSRSCKEALVPAPTKTFPVSLTEIKWPTGETILKTNTDVKNANGLRVTSIELANGSLQPTPSSLRDPLTNVLHTYDVYRADVVLKLTKTVPGTSTGPSSIERKLPITLLYEKGTGTFFQCYLEDSHDSQCADYFAGNFVGTSPPKCHVPITVTDTDYSINTGGSGGGTGTTRFFVNSAGQVGIGTTTPSVALDVVGDFKATNMTASQAINGRNITATQAVTGQNVTATQAVMGRSVTATELVSGQNVTAAQTVSGTNITASQNITATTGSIGGCTLSGGAISCPNTISAGGTGTVVLPSTGTGGTGSSGACGVVSCPAGQLMTGMNGCAPTCVAVNAEIVCGALGGSWDPSASKCNLGGPSSGGNTPEINMYKCPTVGGGALGGGSWGSYGCNGQISFESTCNTVEYPHNRTDPCTYLGKMKLAP